MRERERELKLRIERLNFNSNIVLQTFKEREYCVS